MTFIEQEQLRGEIKHIFESGANEMRIFEMIKSFLQSRPTITVSDKLTMRDKFASKAINSSSMGVGHEKETAKRAYLLADAMLKEREL